MRCILLFLPVILIITFNIGCKFNRQQSDNLCQDSFPEISQYFSDHKGFKYSYLKQDSMYRQIYQDTIRYYDAYTYINMLNLQDAEYIKDKRDIFYKKNIDGTDELRLRRDIFSPIIIHDEGKYKYFEALLDKEQGAKNDIIYKRKDWQDYTYPYQRYVICFILKDSVITYEQFYSINRDNIYSFNQHVYLCIDDNLEFYNLGKENVVKFIPYQKYCPELYDRVMKLLDRSPDHLDNDFVIDYEYPYILTRESSGKEVLRDCKGDTIIAYYNPLKGCFTSMNLWSTNPDRYSMIDNKQVKDYLGID